MQRAVVYAKGKGASVEIHEESGPHDTDELKDWVDGST